MYWIYYNFIWIGCRTKYEIYNLTFMENEHINIVGNEHDIIVINKILEI